jgi:glutamate synthase (NADPH/NADH) large chain
MTKTELTTSTAMQAAGEVKKTAARSTLAERLGTAADNGLYDPSREHDACGVGFVAHMKGEKSHKIISDGLQVLENLTHRGAVGADPLMGDGAGMLVQIPHAFFAAEMEKAGTTLPGAGEYGVGFIFMPQDAALRAKCEEIVERVIRSEGKDLIGWRDVPVDNSSLSKAPDIAATEPVSRQVFIRNSGGDQDAFERRLYVLRKVISNTVRAETDAVSKGFYIVSLSSRTIVYKGMFLAYQVGAYYADLKDERFDLGAGAGAPALLDQHLPVLGPAHPYRMVATTARSTRCAATSTGWPRARRPCVLERCSATTSPALADLLRGPVRHRLLRQRAGVPGHGRLLAGPCAMMMLIPEAWAGNPLMDDNRRAFYEYHAALMEPWDGPAAVAFTDGRQIGATLDRNGLRPARYIVTDDGFVIMSSEIGVLPVEEERIVASGGCSPARCS